MQKPAILLADEPVASLDPITSLQVLDILRQVNREDGLTVLVSLHDVELAKIYGQRIVGINQGRIVVDKHKQHLTNADLVSIYGHDVRDRFADLQAEPELGHKLPVPMVASAISSRPELEMVHK